MRKIRYYKYIYNKESRNTVLTLQGEAYFHEFGRDPDNEAMAIIELENGSILDIGAHLIEFIKPPSEVI